MASYTDLQRFVSPTILGLGVISFVVLFSYNLIAGVTQGAFEGNIIVFMVKSLLFALSPVLSIASLVSLTFLTLIFPVLWAIGVATKRPDAYQTWPPLVKGLFLVLPATVVIYFFLFLISGR
jgi:hypothetical protein